LLSKKKYLGELRVRKDLHSPSARFKLRIPVMRFIADLHIHSKFSRATSRDMVLDTLAHWAKVKGIRLLATGDFTHPEWLFLMKEKLKPSGNGFFEF